MKYKIFTSKPKCVWKSNNILGEGTVWVKELNSVFFVDIKKKKIFSFNIYNKKKKIINLNKQIGFLAHISKSIFILGLEDELRVVNLKSGKIINSIPIEKNIPNNRINDGKIDTIGRLWFGTMDNKERSIKTGSLYCLDENLNLHKVDSNYIVPNGPAFIDAKNFYHTDSRKKTIYKIRVNKSFKITKKKIFLKFNSNDGSPDGMTIDSNKNLWVCHFHGACISVFNKFGKKIHQIGFDAKNITNCTFAGKNNDKLFISSATKSMTKSELKKYRYSGAFFSVKTNMKGFTAKSLFLTNDKKRSLLR